MTYYTRFKTPYWEILLTGSADGLTGLHMMTGEEKRPLIVSDDWIREDSMFAEAKTQLLEYFAGTRKTFSLPLALEGTEFQKKVWETLVQIPYGVVWTYKELAVAVGNPKASRAVGTANGKNPIPIIIPCHRVIAANGKLAGFAFGVDAKDKLISLERSHI